MRADRAVVGDEIAAGFDDEIEHRFGDDGEPLQSFADGGEDLVQRRIHGLGVGIEIAERR